jgi:hypothetical protein
MTITYILTYGMLLSKHCHLCDGYGRSLDREYYLCITYARCTSSCVTKRYPESVLLPAGNKIYVGGLKFAIPEKSRLHAHTDPLQTGAVWIDAHQPC